MIFDVRKKRKKQSVWQKCYCFAAVGLGKIPSEPRWLIVKYAEKWLLSQMGTSIEKMWDEKCYFRQRTSFMCEVSEPRFFASCVILTWERVDLRSQRLDCRLHRGQCHCRPMASLQSSRNHKGGLSTRHAHRWNSCRTYIISTLSSSFFFPASLPDRHPFRPSNCEWIKVIKQYRYFHKKLLSWKWFLLVHW